MPRGNNYRAQILAFVEDNNLYGREVELDRLVEFTGIEPHRISTSIAGMRHDFKYDSNFFIEVGRREGRKIVSWIFHDKTKPPRMETVTELTGARQKKQKSKPSKTDTKWVYQTQKSQDGDPSFWAVDKFADGALLLTRTDGSHWKATKL